MINNQNMDWNNLLQKLNNRVPDQGSKSNDEPPVNLGFLGQINNINPLNGNSPDGKASINEAKIIDRVDPGVLSRSENSQASQIFNYIDDIPDLQVNKVKTSKDGDKNGRTLALNSRFMCYLDEDNVLVIESLKNLSLTHTVHDLDSKIVDICFFEEGLTNNLAFVCANGTVIAYNIDLNQTKDRILVRFELKHNLDRAIEKAQVEWKDPKKFGISIEDELIIFDILSEESLQEPTEEPPKPLSQSSYKLNSAVRDFSFSPGYSLVYVLLNDNNVSVINLENGNKIKEFTPHDVESAGPVVRLLAYKSLVRHQPIKTGEGDSDKAYDYTTRDIFLTVTQNFEVKVWDTSEWDSSSETYFCIETYQLSQINDKLDPISLIKRFVFFDPNLTFAFIAFKANGDKGINVTALHIDRFFYGYSDMYDSGKKSRKFFNSVQNVWFKKNDLTDLYVLNFVDDEIDSYFKKNTYQLDADFDPVSTRTQEGSYGGTSKSILSFFVHNDSSISIFRVWGEKLYPLVIVDDLDKISQADLFDSQFPASKIDGEASFPPELPEFVERLRNETNKVRKEEDKPVKVIAESENTRTETKAQRKYEKPKDDGSELLRSLQGSAPGKEDTTSPDVQKAHGQHKKKQGNEVKKERDAGESHDHNKSKAPTKIVTRENQKNAPAQSSNPKSVESLERELQSLKKDDSQLQAIEKTIEKSVQNAIDKSLQSLNGKFSKIEEAIENKINERVSKLQMDSINNSFAKDVDERLQKEFATAFEKTVTPCFEKYLVKMFEQVCASFEKGHKFYIDKLNIEQAKSAQLKETMNEVIKSFVQISNALTEGLVANQNNYARMEINVQDKQNQIARLIEQLAEVIHKQQEIQRKMENIEKDMHEASYRYSHEINSFRDIAGKFLEKAGEHSSQNYDPRGRQDEGKIDFQNRNHYGANPYTPGAQLFPQNKPAAERPTQTLNDQLAYLQAIMSGKPIDLSGNASVNRPQSPRSAQVINPAYQQPHLDLFNPYQRSKTPNIAVNTGAPSQPIGLNLLTAQQLPSQGQNNYYNSQQQQAAAPQGNQMAPELQALYQNLQNLMKHQQNTDKEEERDRSFNRSLTENSPYAPNSMHQEVSRKFFDQHGNDAPSLSRERSLSQVETQHTPKINSQASGHHDMDTLSNKSNLQLPPGIQNTAPPQTNFVQALLQNLPQNLQQNFTQNTLPQKLNSNFLQNLISNNEAGQNQGHQGHQGQHGQNYSNFGGFYIPPQMINPQINKTAINKPSNLGPSNSVDITNIPLVNSIFKTPSRDAAEETSSTGGTANNIN